MNWYQTTFGNRFDYAARVMVILTAFIIPLSTAAMSIASGLLLIFWLLSGNFGLKFKRIKQSPAALWVLGLFALLAIGLLYSNAEPGATMDTFNRYKKLLIMPIIISLMLSEQWRRYAMRGFMVGMVVLLAMSYMKYFEILTIDTGGPRDPVGHVTSGYTVFKSRIAHSIFMAFFFYLMVQFVISCPRWRWLCLTLAILTIHNILFMVTGQSGYVILICLITLLLYQHIGWKGLLIGILVAPLLLGITYYGSSNFKSRFHESATDFLEYTPGDYENYRGISYRREYFQGALKIIQKSPIYGHGTGSFAVEYKKVADEKGLKPAHDPHNEFLMLTSQLGLIGLTAFCLMLLSQWRASFRLDRENRLILQGLLVTMITGCLFNSLLLNSTEGKFYLILLAIIFSIPSQQEGNNSIEVSGST